MFCVNLLRYALFSYMVTLTWCCNTNKQLRGKSNFLLVVWRGQVVMLHALTSHDQKQISLLGFGWVLFPSKLFQWLLIAPYFLTSTIVAIHSLVVPIVVGYSTNVLSTRESITRSYEIATMHLFLFLCIIIKSRRLHCIWRHNLVMVLVVKNCASESSWVIQWNTSPRDQNYLNVGHPGGATQWKFWFKQINGSR